MPNLTPTFSERHIAIIASELFGIEGEVSPLVSFEDQNARIKTADGSYVLKIANKRWGISELRMQAEVLKYLEEVAPDFILPRVIPTKSGETITFVDDFPVRLITYIEGNIFADVPKTPELYRDLGNYMGRFNKAMQGFSHPASFRPDDMWNLDNVLACKEYVADVVNDDARARIGRMYERYETQIMPKLKPLRRAVCHHDANDQNLLVSKDDATQMTGLIDFGDMAHATIVNELAITLAYCLFNEKDFLATSREIITGYVKEFPLQEAELDVLFDLAAMRLVQSIVMTSHRAKEFPENDYIIISQRPSILLLEQMEATGFEFLSEFATLFFSDHAQVSLDGIETLNLFPFALKQEDGVKVSMRDGAEGSELIADQKAYSTWLNDKMQAAGAKFSIGAYGEDRSCYTSANFVDTASGEPRSVHMGLDLFVPAGTPLYAPLGGKVFSVHDNAGALDYGPTIILEHKVPDRDVTFYTLYGHLARRSLSMLRVGDEVAAGQQIGLIGDMDVNGGWAPHLHLQIMTHMLGNRHDFPGACEASRWEIWQNICLDPDLLLCLE